MKHVDKQYKSLVKKIIKEGIDVPSRQGVTCRKIFGHQMHIDLDRFPLLTTKEMNFRSILNEFNWMVSGSTSVADALNNDVFVWTDDAIAAYMKRGFNPMNRTDFIKRTVTEMDFEESYGGHKIAPYGRNLRDWYGIDQLNVAVNALVKNPYNRRNLIIGWDAATVDEYYLPQCHSIVVQLNCRPVESKTDTHLVTPRNYLDMFTYTRSQDVALGMPYNIAFSALLCYTIASLANRKQHHGNQLFAPGTLVYTTGDTHLYQNQIEPIKEQLRRRPRKLPKLYITARDWNDMDIKLKDYNPHPKIKIPLTT